MNRELNLFKLVFRAWPLCRAKNTRVCPGAAYGICTYQKLATY